MKVGELGEKRKHEDKNRSCFNLLPRMQYRKKKLIKKRKMREKIERENIFIDIAIIVSRSANVVNRLHALH